MKTTYLILLCLCISTVTFAQKNTEELKGIWTIDLRPTPTSEAYFKSFEIKKIKGNIFGGTFYGSRFKKGLFNTQWDRIYFAFATSDGSNDYYHSGYFLDGKVYGITYCPNRNFTAPWTGEKTDIKP